MCSFLGVVDLGYCVCVCVLFFGLFCFFIGIIIFVAIIFYKWLPLECLFLDSAFGPILYFGKAESKALGSSAIWATEEFCYGDLWDNAEFSEALRDT